MGEIERMSRSERRDESAHLALMLWNNAYLYGSVPAAKQAVEALRRCGYPTAGMLELVEQHWKDVAAAQTGWAAHPLVGADDEHTPRGPSDA